MKINSTPLMQFFTSYRLLLTLFASLALFGCHSSGNRIKKPAEKLNIKVERFDRELFEISTDTLAQSLTRLYRNYDDFLDVFSYHIIGIGSPASRDYQTYMLLFLNDRLNREVYGEVQKIFPDLEPLEKEMSTAFSLYKSAYPGSNIPRVIAYVSRFNNSTFTVGNYIGIGIDRYMGTACSYYKRLELPQYIRVNMFPEKMPSDAIYTWASSLFPFNDSLDNVLGRMIHEGKLLYFTSALLPDEPDSLVIGFTKNQMKWAKNNERDMWTYLVEKKILFSRDAMDIRKLTGPAPFTYFFSNESPGKTGSYIGWKIFGEYARRNPGISFREMMAETDYEKILRLSKYNP
jgi:hypothetical protein